MVSWSRSPLTVTAKQMLGEMIGFPVAWGRERFCLLSARNPCKLSWRAQWWPCFASIWAVWRVAGGRRIPEKDEVAPQSCPSLLNVILKFKSFLSIPFIFPCKPENGHVNIHPPQGKLSIPHLWLGFWSSSNCQIFFWMNIWSLVPPQATISQVLVKGLLAGHGFRASGLLPLSQSLSAENPCWASLISEYINLISEYIFL